MEMGLNKLLPFWLPLLLECTPPWEILATKSIAYVLLKLFLSCIHSDIELQLLQEEDALEKAKRCSL